MHKGGFRGTGDRRGRIPIAYLQQHSFFYEARAFDGL